MNLTFPLSITIGALVWFALIGWDGWKGILLGLPVILSAWWLTQHLSLFDKRIPASRALSAGGFFFGYFLRIAFPAMVFSAWKVASEILKPTIRLRPGIFAIPIPEASREALLLLAYGISLSADEQVIAIDEERRILYIHNMDASDPEAVRRRLSAHYEKYVRKATPP